MRTLLCSLVLFVLSAQIKGLTEDEQRRILFDKAMQSLSASALLCEGQKQTLQETTDFDFNFNINETDTEGIKVMLQESEKQATETFKQENERFLQVDKRKLQSKDLVSGPHLLTAGQSLKIHPCGTIVAEATGTVVKDLMKQDTDRQTSKVSRVVSFLDVLRDLRLIPPIQCCPYSAPINCKGALTYRRIDGSCNNLLHPYWGKSFTPHERFLSPEYEGTNQPRKFAVSSNLLPLVREISTTVHTASVVPDDLFPKTTYYLMQFGQFLDHDITKTAVSKGYGGADIDCCLHPSRRDCCPIEIPADDPYYNGNRSCMNFVRSTATPNLDCDWAVRQQINELTSFIDGSNVYGSTQSELNALRDGTTAFMKTSSGEKLPLDTSNLSQCRINPTTKPCFLAGDKRANVIPGLSTIHTIWLREHNRVATILKSNNPSWSDEIVFQEARRFVIAEMQHIVYGEFLPRILHDFFMTIFDLKPKAVGYFSGYDNAVKPMIRNAFATAAYRFGHSLVRDKFFFNADQHDLHLHFNHPNLVHEPQGIEGCTRGLYQVEAQGIDELLTPEITNRLFEDLSVSFSGEDLASFNIKRGRDHGIPPYTKWVRACFGPWFSINNFNPGVFGGLLFHDADAAAKLQSIYEHPDDMDLFTAGMAETNMPGSKLGPTFSCIIAAQFRALKYGDRFYYETDTTHPFTLPQLDSIRQTKMSRIICDNTDIEALQREVFLEEHSISNPLTNCTDFPGLDLPCDDTDGGWTPWTKDPNYKCIERRFCTNPTPGPCGAPCTGLNIRYTCLISAEDSVFVKSKT